MGSWGIGPYDNDSAGDFMDDLINPKFIKRVEKLASKTKWNENDYQELRASAETIILLNHSFQETTIPFIFETCVSGIAEGLEAILSDDDWFASWCDPRDGKGVKKQIRKLIRDLNDLEC